MYSPFLVFLAFREKGLHEVGVALEHHVRTASTSFQETLADTEMGFARTVPIAAHQVSASAMNSKLSPPTTSDQRKTLEKLASVFNIRCINKSSIQSAFSFPRPSYSGTCPNPEAHFRAHNQHLLAHLETIREHAGDESNMIFLQSFLSEDWIKKFKSHFNVARDFSTATLTSDRQPTPKVFPVPKASIHDSQRDKPSPIFLGNSSPKRKSALSSSKLFEHLINMLEFAATYQLMSLNMIDRKLILYASLEEEENDEVLQQLKKVEVLLRHRKQKKKCAHSDIITLIEEHDRTDGKVVQDFEHLVKLSEELHSRIKDATSVLNSTISMGMAQNAKMGQSN